jgi:hypothetical protein
MRYTTIINNPQPIILNDQLHYKSHTLFDTITHASYISANQTTMNQKTNFIAASSTETTKHMVHMALKSFCYNLK